MPNDAVNLATQDNVELSDSPACTTPGHNRAPDPLKTGKVKMSDYSPRHAVVRAVHALPRWAKIAAATAATLGATFGGLAVAGASTGPARFSGEEAGYQTTGIYATQVHARAYLRNPSQFSSELQGYGYSVQLISGGQEIVLGISNATTGGSPWFPGMAVFNPETHGLICSTASASQPCPGGSFGSASFPVGDTVQFELNYSPKSGLVTAVVGDGTENIATVDYQAGTGVNFTHTRVGMEDGCTPFDITGNACGGTYHHPGAVTKWGRLSGVTITNTHGRSYSLGTGHYFAVSKITMTANGASSGALEAAAGGLSKGAFDTYLH